MKLGRYIYNRLITHASLTALVGTRIYPVVAPQNATYPLITYSIIKAPLDRSKQCAGDYMRATVQLTIWADWQDGQNAYDALDDIEAILLARLDYQEATAGGITVSHCAFDNSSDAVDDGLLALARNCTYNFILATDQ